MHLLASAASGENSEHFPNLRAGLREGIMVERGEEKGGMEGKGKEREGKAPNLF